MGGGMMTTDWTPVLIVLGIGLVAGLVLAIRFVRGAPVGKAGTGSAKPDRSLAPELELELRDLGARRDGLLARLAELEETAPGQVGPARVALERRELELLAARTLRELASLEAKAGVALPARAAPAAARPAVEGPARWKGLAYAIGGAAFFLAAILAVRQFSTAKPGMGGMGMGAAPTADMAHTGEAPPNPRIDALKAELAAHPEDVEVRLDLAEQYLVDGRLFEAFEASKPVLDKQPENPRALTYLAVVKLAMGQVEEAGTMLDTAIRIDPKLAEAWSYRGLVRFQAERFGDAVRDWEQALSLRPDGRDSLEPLIAQAKQRAAAGGTVAAAGMPEATPAPAPMLAPAPTAAAPVGVPAGAKLAGVVELAPSVAGRAVPSATLFVIVRPDGMMAGPPVAVRRIDGPRFPLSFSLGSEHSMTGAPLPERMSLEVRLDGDGNAMTRDPADPIARLSGVALGTTELRLQLEQQ